MRVKKAIHSKPNGGEGSRVEWWSEGDGGNPSVAEGVHRMEDELVTLAS